ncbi:MAG: class I SAM-dependent methyltransferase [Alphaproteobacteria bacterium]|nr:MAG: class I SAM-dependent methyltransferase [Alphaproteobacteria bacterium]
MNDTGNLGPAVAFHEELSESWGEKYRGGIFSRRLQVFGRIVSEYCRSGTQWLDAGCGVGNLTRLLADHGARVTGVDASPGMIEHAGNVLHEAGVADRCELMCIETIETMPFPSGRFDGVICSSVVEYLDSDRAGLQELHRVIKDGGLLVATVPNRWALLRMLQRLAFGLTGRPRYLQFSKNHYTAKQFRSLVVDVGFTVEHVEYTSFWPCRLVPAVSGALALYVLRKF